VGYNFISDPSGIAAHAGGIKFNRSVKAA
jgi:hypothetical protein